MRPLLSFPKSMLAVLTLLLVLPGCFLVVEEDDYYDDYHHHGWRLDVTVEYGRTLSADAPYTISFETDGRLSGQAGCTSYDGTYDEPSDGRLSIREIRSAGEACGRQSLEDSYIEVLSSAVSYRLQGDDLIITSRAGDILHFIKIDA